MKKLCVILLLIWLLIPFYCLAGDVNENSSATLTLTFKDASGVAQTPTTIKYRIDDLSSGTAMVAITSITPSSSIYVLPIVSATNRIISSARPYEQRKVSIQWYVGSTLAGTADYVYKVLNLSYVPFP